MKKTLTVPQVGTQPAQVQTPMEKMFSETPAKKPSDKRPTSFSLDPNLLIQFKTRCVQQGRSMTAVIEELMQNFIVNA